MGKKQATAQKHAAHIAHLHCVSVLYSTTSNSTQLWPGWSQRRLHTTSATSYCLYVNLASCLHPRCCMK